jgi:hypothetical protein
MMPNILAQNILGVQPMADMINSFSKKWEKVGMDMPADKWVYNVRSQEIRDWIEEQPIHMWKFYDFNDTKLHLSLASIGQNYVFLEEMESWFLLRWS